MTVLLFHIYSPKMSQYLLVYIHLVISSMNLYDAPESVFNTSTWFCWYESRILWEVVWLNTSHCTSLYFVYMITHCCWCIRTFFQVNVRRRGCCHVAFVIFEQRPLPGWIGRKMHILCRGAGCVDVGLMDHVDAVCTRKLRSFLTYFILVLCDFQDSGAGINTICRQKTQNLPWDQRRGRLVCLPIKHSTRLWFEPQWFDLNSISCWRIWYTEQCVFFQSRFCVCTTWRKVC
jgi:hypothetical protein